MRHISISATVYRRTRNIVCPRRPREVAAISRLRLAVYGSRAWRISPPAIHVPIYTRVQGCVRRSGHASRVICREAEFPPSGVLRPIAPDRGVSALGGRGTFRIEEFPPNPLRFCICASRFGVLLASSRPMPGRLPFDGISRPPPADRSMHIRHHWTVKCPLWRKRRRTAGICAQPGITCRCKTQFTIMRRTCKVAL